MIKQQDGRTDFYSERYARIGSELAAELRREVYGTDNGQMNWRTAAEEAEIAKFLRVGHTSRVLDVACGSGGPSLALVERIRCQLTGVDLADPGIAYAQSQASARGLADQATFAVMDCGAPSPLRIVASMPYFASTPSCTFGTALGRCATGLASFATGDVSYSPMRLLLPAR